LVQKFIFLFFSPWLREEREKFSNSDSRERKVSLTQI